MDHPLADAPAQANSFRVPVMELDQEQEPYVPSSMSPPEPEATTPSAEPREAGREQQGPSSNNTNTGNAASAANEDMVVLTPTRVRVDSRVVFVHCTSNWLSNCFLAILVLCKLNGSINASWWLIFLPAWIHHSISIPLQGIVVYFHKHLVEKHIGPPPPPDASPTLALQYSILRKIRVKSHIVDATNQGIDCLALFLVKILMCYQLVERTSVNSNGNTAVDWWSFRLVFIPFWIAWAATTVMSFLKDKQERVFGSARDLQYVFFLFVALKLDAHSDYSWRIVFLIPWLWFAAIFLLAIVVGILLVLARVWARITELMLPLGFLGLLIACVPQFISYVGLVGMLDDMERTGTSAYSVEAILLPNAVSWFLMWIASLVLVVGLRRKEHLRETLLAAGHVWTAHEHLANRMATEAAESAQRRVDLMSDEEVSCLVEEMMRGKTKPGTLVRVGESLYRSLAGNDGTEVLPMEPGDVEEGDDSLLPKQDRSDEVEPVGLEAANGSSRMSSNGRWGLPAVSLPGQLDDETQSDDGARSEKDAAKVHPLEDEIRRLSKLSELSDDNTCIICCDRPPTCVFLTCGHGGICRRCANLLFLRPPNECPTCRGKIDQIVELESPSKKIGDVIRVL